MVANMTPVFNLLNEPNLSGTVPSSGPADKASDDHVTPGLANDDLVEPASRTDSNHAVQLETSRLLSLPKELRLEIWQYVLHDPLDGNPVLRITRDLNVYQSSRKRFTNSLYKHPESPEISTHFEKASKCRIGVALLRTNHIIYAEALPILYRPVVFHIWDLEGIFPLFFDTLSDYAKANIRCIRLTTRTALESKHACFYWALTCAQIAKLNHSSTLLQVQVRGLPSGDKEINKRVIYAPLLRIKASIVCLDGKDEAFQQVLAETAVEREAKAVLRKAATEADAVERREPAPPRLDVDRPIKKRQKIQDLQELTIRGRPEVPKYSPTIDESELAHDLAEVPGFEDFDKDMSDWEIVLEGGRRLHMRNHYETAMANQSYDSPAAFSPPSPVYDSSFSFGSPISLCRVDDEEFNDWEVLEVSS